MSTCAPCRWVANRLEVTGPGHQAKSSLFFQPDAVILSGCPTRLVGRLVHLSEKKQLKTVKNTGKLRGIWRSSLSILL